MKYEPPKLIEKPIYQSKKWLIEKYVIEKMSHRKIAKLCESGPTTIGRYLNKYEITRKDLYKDKSWLSKKYLKEGKSSYEIGNLCSVSSTTIRNWINKLNIKRDKPKYHNKKWLISKVIEEKLSYNEIAIQCGCTKGAIGWWVRKFNIQRPETIFLYDDKNWLIKKYWTEKNTLSDIAILCNTGSSTILRKMKKFGIKRRPSYAAMRGDRHPLWKGTQALQKRIRKLKKYREYRSECFNRDDFTCQVCGSYGVKLNADHIRPFSLLIDEHEITSLKDALKCEYLWDLNNLRTLCIPCHQETETYLKPISHIKELYEDEDEDATD